ncbi:ADAM family mig-17, partial [Biomphalaria glabrata]
ACDDTDDQMPDQVNVTFQTHSDTLTKLNLRRMQSANLDIPLYTLDVDREGNFQRHKVKTEPIKVRAEVNNLSVQRVPTVKHTSKACRL